ncbi:hypothetical protein PG994_014113 [Apiospora phragmitis]|uniref:Uncharacterized protein n=1 Tax=Apiospora phragmitis TaxID=2905665 RepID=A0ABR1T4Y6_9PEZI
MEANKQNSETKPGGAAAKRPSSSVNPFKEVFEVSIKTIEISEKDLESKSKAWRENNDADKNAELDSRVAVSRGRLKEDVDNAARVVESAQGYAGIREEAADLMRTVRRVRQEHLGEGSDS